MKKKKYRLRYDRVLLTLAILIMLILGIVLIVRSFLTKEIAPANANTSAVTDDAEDQLSEDPNIASGTTEVQGDIHAGFLILVNNDHAVAKVDTDSLVEISSEAGYSFQLARNGMSLNEVALTQLERMIADYRSETGDSGVTLISAYRSIESQLEIWDDEVADKGEEEAYRWVAQPGYSEHQTGYALDFSVYYGASSSMVFGDSDAYVWLQEHAAEYGYFQRYPEDKETITGIATEPWHYRYVGRVHAEAINKTDYCYEEYIDYLKQFTYEGEHLSVTVEGVEYEIYYAAGDSITVPKGAEYEVSGNNVDGLIVTIKKS